MSRLLVDANVLLSTADPTRNNSLVASAAFHRLSQNDELVYCNQVFAEFLAVATRTKGANGFGWSATFAFGTFDALAAKMSWLPEPQSIYETLRELYDGGRVRAGANVHDAKLAAFGLVHDLDGILTSNDRDFRRCGLNVVDPA